MTDPQTQREKTSLKQLSSVSHARQVRLKTERHALAEHERMLEQALECQRGDEALLARQQDQWMSAWQAWAQTGGTLRQAAALRHDKVLLADMAALVACGRADLQRRVDGLDADLRAWALRWRAAQAFDESLSERRRALRASLEQASERQRDEEALTVLAATRSSDTAVAAGQRVGHAT